MDLSNEFHQLDQLQTSLLSAFHSISPSQSNETNRLSIINDTYKYQEILNFVQSELDFLYNYPAEVEIYEGIEDIFQFDKASEFLLNFRRNFGELQFKLRDGIKQSFQQNKETKYKINHPAEDEKDLAQTFKLENLSSSKSINDKLLSTNKTITSKLQQSSTVLQSTLLQSQLNLDDLTTQDHTLSELSDKYTSLKGVLDKSDEFVKNIRLSNKRDKQRMYYSLIFFAVCCAKVIWSRLLKFPYRICKYFLWLVFWSVGLVSKSAEIPDGIHTVSYSSSILKQEQINDPISTTSTVIEVLAKQSHQPVIKQIIQHVEEPEVLIEISNEAEDSFSEEQTESYEEQLSRIIDEL